MFTRFDRINKRDRWTVRWHRKHLQHRAEQTLSKPKNRTRLGKLYLEETFVPFLNFIIVELRVGAEVLQLLRLQLAVLFSHQYDQLMITGQQLDSRRETDVAERLIPTLNRHKHTSLQTSIISFFTSQPMFIQHFTATGSHDCVVTLHGLWTFCPPGSFTPCTFRPDRLQRRKVH